MKRIALATLLLLAGILLQERVHAQTGIIPKPVNVRETGRTIDLPQSVVIGSNDAELLRLADLFVSRLERDGFSGLSTAKSLRKATVKLSIDPALAEEGYTLDSTSDKEEILLAGGSVKGVWWGLQTLEQLLVATTENPAQMRIPALRIEDAPRFAYRGAHLDCGRHFFTTDEVKTYIDIISAHKINTFHWHLTEDQGWRIEIKKYPELTRIGSQRPETYVGHLYAHTGKYDGTPHGGYYTQDEIRDIVAYAAERQITIIPEIEMPGHAVAALASYPWLGCRGEGYEVWTSWGVNKDIFCVGKETTFEFLQNVLDEVCDLFPGEYIHIGGDEAPRDSWKTCPHCQKRMKELGLEKEAQLQSYLVARIEKYLNAKGRKIIGWDEILEGGVTPTATVMSWRGAEGGIAAAKQGNDAIMVPYQYLYLDYSQTRDQAVYGEPLAIDSGLTLEKCYSFDPFAGLNEEERAHIKGVQANLWTEYIADFGHVQHMLLPRLSAAAEIAWSSEKTDIDTLRRRIRDFMLPLYKARGYRYATYEFWFLD